MCSKRILLEAFGELSAKLMFGTKQFPHGVWQTVQLVLLYSLWKLLPTCSITWAQPTEHSKKSTIPLILTAKNQLWRQRWWIQHIKIVEILLQFWSTSMRWKIWWTCYAFSPFCDEGWKLLMHIMNAWIHLDLTVRTCPSKFYFQKTAACNQNEPGGQCKGKKAGDIVSKEVWGDISTRYINGLACLIMLASHSIVQYYSLMLMFKGFRSIKVGHAQELVYILFENTYQ